MDSKVSFSNPPASHKDWRIETGCYVDSARGIYAIDRIAQIAEQYGYNPSCDCTSCLASDTWSKCDYLGEMEDSIDNFMNNRFAVDGYYWGRSENGDWGLWQNEDEA